MCVIFVFVEFYWTDCSDEVVVSVTYASSTHEKVLM